MKTLLMKAWLPASLLLAVAFLLAACGSAGGGQQGSGSGGGMAGMDHGQMGHGSMGMGSKGMARQMVLHNGQYSERRFIDAMVPHHQGAIAMAKVALKNAEHEEIKELSRSIISTQQAEIEEHHWSDPATGLAEIYRVLKPGGEARIYDLAHWLWRPAHGGDRLTQLAAASPFGGGEVEVVRWPGSVPAFVLLRLRRTSDG